jgi:hypothetical protein
MCGKESDWTMSRLRATKKSAKEFGIVIACISDVLELDFPSACAVGLDQGCKPPLALVSDKCDTFRGLQMKRQKAQERCITAAEEEYSITIERNLCAAMEGDMHGSLELSKKALGLQFKIQQLTVALA